MDDFSCRTWLDRLIQLTLSLTIAPSPTVGAVPAGIAKLLAELQKNPGRDPTPILRPFIACLGFINDNFDVVQSVLSTVSIGLPPGLPLVPQAGLFVLSLPGVRFSEFSFVFV